MAVGRREDFGKPPATLGLPVASIDLSIPEPAPETAKADAASLAEGKQLLEKVQRAVGGAEKLAAVKDLVEVTDFQLDAAAGGLKVAQTNRWIAPENFRQESQLPTGKIAAFLA